VGWDNKKQRKIYRVLVGSFATKNASSLTQRQLKRGGFNGFLARHQLR
jgi:cell division protein FtsN